MAELANTINASLSDRQTYCVTIQPGHLIPGFLCGRLLEANYDPPRVGRSDPLIPDILVDPGPHTPTLTKAASRSRAGCSFHTTRTKFHSPVSDGCRIASMPHSPFGPRRSRRSWRVHPAYPGPKASTAAAPGYMQSALKYWRRRMPSRRVRGEKMAGEYDDVPNWLH